MKNCPDCGARCAATAVTCFECGSLFDDMVGVGHVDSDDEPDAEPTAAAAVASGSPAAPPPANAVAECRECGVLNEATQRRCRRCGSNQLTVRLDGRTGPSQRAGRRLTAWDRRPRIGALDLGVPDLTLQFAVTFLAIGALKLLLLSYLGGMLAFGRTGPNGLQPIAFEWKFALSPVLFMDGFLGALGAFGLYRARRSGAWMLGASFVLDLFLLGWVVVLSYADRLLIWPGPGPYVALGLFCAFCAAEVFGKALRGNLK